MLKISPAELAQRDQSYPDLAADVLALEAKALPACRQCGSPDTALVQFGLVGRSMTMAAATTRFRLHANSPAAGKFYCNGCQQYFT